MSSKLLRQFIRKTLREGLADVVAAEARIRVDVSSPGTPTYNDVLTGIRGIPNVITVRTDGHLEKAGGKKQIANIVVRYESKASFGPAELEKELLKVDGVDLSRVLTVDGAPWKKKEAPAPEDDKKATKPEPKPKPKAPPVPTLSLD